MCCYFNEICLFIITLIFISGILCQIEINECEDNPCQNQAQCYDEIGDYRCTCQIGWTGKNCSQEFDPCRSNPCENNATCTILPDLLHPPYSCDCKPGFSGDRCEVDVDDCVSVTCPYNELCLDLVNAYECLCNPGFARDDLNNCTIDIDECASNPCQNGGNCSDLLNEFKCVCKFGYEGDLCDREVDFCASEPCLNGGLCVSNFGSYVCFCKSNFVGFRCEAMFDPCLSDPCWNGNCTSAGGAYQCLCDIGYEGYSCETEINECTSNPCLNGGNCSDLIGRFNCSCSQGWSGEICDVNIDECLSMPCKNGANCTDEVSGYTCHCSNGYTGDHCDVNIDECGSSPCLHGGWCVDGVASYRCVCDDTGYEGQFCQTEIDECERGSSCQHGSRCIDRVNDYTCQCLSGYTGRFCEIDIKECHSQPCQNNGSCLELSDISFYPTLIPSNFSYQEASGFLCNCTDGFEGDFCEMEIDECGRWNPCHNNATCIDKINDYHCECPPGIGGKNCSVPLLGCSSGNNCSENAVCKPYLKDESENLHSYTCECFPGYAGPFCGRSTSGTFRGSQSRAVFLVQPSKTSVFISFAFRTTLLEGTLAALHFNSTNTILMIDLHQGHLRNSLSNTTIAFDSKSFQSDGEWHSVFVRLHLGSKFAFIDFSDSESNSTIAVSTSSAFVRIELGRSGSFPNPPFVGCIRDVIVNGILRQFKDADFAEGIEEGCDKPVVCFPTSCSGRGVCNDLWFESSCKCSRPYIGANCSFESTFNTFGYKDLQSYAEFRLPFTRVPQFNISMFLMTRQSDGFLLQAGTPNSSSSFESTTTVRFHLTQGFLQVDLEKQVYSFNQVDLADGEKHFLFISINETRISVTIDEESYYKTIIMNANFISTNSIFVGGLPPFWEGNGKRQKREVSASRGFKGAIQDIQVGKIVLILFPDDQKHHSVARSRVLPIEIANIERGLISDPLCGERNSNWTVNPCQNNGTCRTTFNDYTCVCTDGWQGRNCENPIYCEHITCPGNFSCSNLPRGGVECVGPTTVNASSEILVFHYNSTAINLTNNKIFFKIRTRSTNTPILLVESKTGFVRVDLDHVGRVQVITSNRVNYTHNYDSINDGKWHTVEFLEQEKSLFLTIDNRPKVPTNLTFGSALKSIFSEPDNRIHLGNRRNLSFIGCIDELRIGGQLLPFYDWSLVSNNMPTPSNLVFRLLSGVPFHGCHGEDVCNQPENPCHNNGSCIDLFNQFRCECEPGFSGVACEHDIDDCVNVTCSGRGQCTDQENGFTCECEIGFEGRLCEIDIDECSFFPCYNNGTCRNMIGSYECDCSGTNFTGVRCETDVTHACASGKDSQAPCENGGTCKNMTSENKILFHCFCSPFFGGDKCQKFIDPCENVTCLHGGYCVIDSLTMATKCQCLTGFRGEICDEKIDPCSNSSCLNNATCLSTDSSYRCQCGVGFVGEYCEYRNLCFGAASSSNYCANNATCLIRFDPNPKFSCRCNSTFTGERCNYVNPCTSVPCLNGGKCEVTWPALKSSGSNHLSKIGLPDFKCDCQSGFSGKNCQLKSHLHHSALILGSSIGGVVLFLLLISGMSYFLATAVDRRATSGAYSPSKREAMNSGPPVPSGFVGMEMWTELKPPPRCERLI